MNDDVTLDLFLPVGPCADCVRTLKRDTTTGQIHMHCSHNQVGGTWNPKLERWTLVSPIAAADLDTWIRERQTIKQGMVNLAAGIVPTDDNDAIH